MNNDNIMSALDSLPVAAMTRDEWIAVGMALKEEGYPCSTWEEWSRNDTRYKQGECERIWSGFHGSASPVKGGTIVRMARDRGWTPYSGDGCMDWGDEIERDGEGPSETEKQDGASEFREYIKALFKPDEIVGYVTGDVWQGSDGRWSPSRGVYNRTAGDLLAALDKHPGDLGAVVGDWEKEAGAWIRFNPLDGQGVKNDNVVNFRHALVESDTLPVNEQIALYRKLELPIAALVHSGGKSVHAIVKIEAANNAEYRERVGFLYDHLAKNGVEIDKQNKNPSRLSRMPGATRNGKPQRLLAVNVGRPSWKDWVDLVEERSDDLPKVEKLSAYWIALPPLPAPLIHGVVRKRHKMLISGPSKAGKSFLLMEMAICLAAGIPWLGFECEASRVMYINLEIDKNSAIHRFYNIYEAMALPRDSMENIDVWNLRGCAVPLDRLAPAIIRRAKGEGYGAIIIDPIYKIITGDENNASEMGSFCNHFDAICNETGAATIYCHHHSKGAQGMKKAMDRASGSGVFARDPDAQLDMIQLELTDDLKNRVRDGYATAWRIESSLREFPNFRPINVWFNCPIHVLDTSGELDAAYAEGSPLGNLAKSGKACKKNDRRRQVLDAYEACSISMPVTVDDMAAFMDVGVRCARDRINEFKDLFVIKGGSVFRINGGEENGEISRSTAK